jgi:hypothetical protein
MDCDHEAAFKPGDRVTCWGRPNCELLARLPDGAGFDVLLTDRPGFVVVQMPLEALAPAK